MQAIAGHARRALVDVRDDAPAAHDADPLAELVTMLRDKARTGDPAIVREYRLSLAALSARQAALTPEMRYVDTDEWSGLRTRILDALGPFPDARQAVADAIA
jgi:hypothetical protein